MKRKQILLSTTPVLSVKMQIMRVYGRLGQLKRCQEETNPHMMIGLCGCMMQEPDSCRED